MAGPRTVIPNVVTQSALIQAEPTKDVLFDRIIGFRLCQSSLKYTDDEEVIDETTGVKSKVIKQMPDAVYSCPSTGEKPNISLQFSMLPGSYTNAVTLSVSNFYTTHDICSYKYIVITAGYRGRNKKGTELTRTFRGEIINAYIASPNPNGTFVIQCALASFIDFNAQWLNQEYNQDDLGVTCGSILTNILRLTQERIPQITMDLSELPEYWINYQLQPEKFQVNFTSVADMLSQVNSWLQQAYRVEHDQNLNAEFSPISLVLDDNRIRVYADENATSTSDIKTVTLVKQAYIEGDHGIIDAPWNPSIHVGDIVYVPKRFFRSRILMSYFDTSANFQLDLWRVYKIEVNFATTGTTNSMRLQLINVRNVSVMQSVNS